MQSIDQKTSPVLYLYMCRIHFRPFLISGRYWI
uniref:Uncharacterized protein n=1 Tax=Arundo donax TaxID=35708 RepID=A0A0A9GEQ9_ARUDO